MNTLLSSAQEAAKAQYQAFAVEHIAPVAKALDERNVNLVNSGKKSVKLPCSGYRFLKSMAVNQPRS